MDERTAEEILNTLRVQLQEGYEIEFSDEEWQDFVNLRVVAGRRNDTRPLEFKTRCCGEMLMLDATVRGDDLWVKFGLPIGVSDDVIACTEQFADKWHAGLPNSYRVRVQGWGLEEGDGFQPKKRFTFPKSSPN